MTTVISVAPVGVLVEVKLSHQGTVYRTTLSPGIDVAAYMNAAMASLGWPAIDWGSITAVTNTVWTPQVLADWAAAHPGPNATEQAEAARIVSIEAAIAGDTTVAALKAMSNAEFDAWWTANVTNLSQANNVLKRIARVVLRRVL